MDASQYAAVAAVAFVLGVIFACGLGLGLAAAVRLQRRIERVERRYKSLAQIGEHRTSTGGPATGRHRVGTPLYDIEYPPPPMVRPREPHGQQAEATRG
ncbi:hypothetical protein AB0A05_26960 [Streptomyces sp. NPDC046374]|uniref:hypothetical protein n=1 Tax=Streptomyces sp. NPDC046374 TaxID=3154917 RepID=UPI0033EEC1FB